MKNHSKIGKGNKANKRADWNRKNEFLKSIHREIAASQQTQENQELTDLEYDWLMIQSGQI